MWDTAGQWEGENRKRGGKAEKKTRERRDREQWKRGENSNRCRRGEKELQKETGTTSVWFKSSKAVRCLRELRHMLQ